MKKTIGIVGARGHTGAELIRLIGNHPQLELVFVSSRELAGQRVSEHIAGWSGELRYESLGHEQVAAKAADAPKLDGVADDAVWKSAAVVSFKAVKGANFKDGKGETQGTVQAAYVGDMLYLLVTYDDPTLSVQRSPFVKKADGTWEKMKDPDDKGGDNNKVYEDKMALIWNIDDSIFGFNERFSCQAACHAGEPGKPYGNKYTGDDGEIGREIRSGKTLLAGVDGA